MELVSLISGESSLRAAVAGGADAVRAGLQGCCSPNVCGMKLKALVAAAAYCRVRGVKFYVSLDLPMTPERFERAMKAAELLCRAGVDAICVGDPGLLTALHRRMPELALHAGEALGIHDSGGAALAAELGVTRLLLPQQLSGECIRRICAQRRTEIELILHGSACPGWNSPCRFSAFTGRGSASSGHCSRPCTQRFDSAAGPLYLCTRAADLSSHLPELADWGISALSLPGADMPAEYHGMAVELFHRAISLGKAPSRHDLALLASFRSEGSSDGFFRGKPEEAFVGDVREQSASGRAHWQDPGEFQRVEVSFYASLRAGSPAQLAVRDGQGNQAKVRGSIPARAGSGRRELSEALLRTQLLNTLGTPYLCRDVKLQLEPGLHLPGAEISQMRREALQKLSLLRQTAPEPLLRPLPPLPPCEERREEPDITVSVQRTAQLSRELALMKPRLLYLPLAELLREPAAITPFWENGVTQVCAVLPPVVSDDEALEVYSRLRSLKEIHIRDVLVSTPGQLKVAGLLGFRVRCSVEMNVMNDRSLHCLRELGAASVILSPELNLKQIRSLKKYTDTELYAYGRLPLMVTARRAEGEAADGTAVLRDLRGRSYPLLPCGSRSILYGSERLFLADRMKDLRDLGIWCLHLAFTTENAETCTAITARYLQLGPYEPNSKTKGLYYENETGFGFRFPSPPGASGHAGRF